MGLRECLQRSCSLLALRTRASPRLQVLHTPGQRLQLLPRAGDQRGLAVGHLLRRLVDCRVVVLGAERPRPRLLGQQVLGALLRHIAAQLLAVLHHSGRLVLGAAGRTVLGRNHLQLGRGRRHLALVLLRLACEDGEDDALQALHALLGNGDGRLQAWLQLCDLRTGGTVVILQQRHQRCLHLLGGHHLLRRLVDRHSGLL